MRVWVTVPVQCSPFARGVCVFVCERLSLSLSPFRSLCVPRGGSPFPFSLFLRFLLYLGPPSSSQAPSRPVTSRRRDPLPVTRAEPAATATAAAAAEERRGAIPWSSRSPGHPSSAALASAVPSAASVPAGSRALRCSRDGSGIAFFPRPFRARATGLGHGSGASRTPRRFVVLEVLEGDRRGRVTVLKRV